MKEKKTNIKRTLYRGISTLKSDSKNRGITLVALVITIILLLILAAVVINLSLGNNGIFNRAKTAKEQYQNAQDYEETEIAKMSNRIDSYINGNRDNISLNYSLDEQSVGTWIDGKPIYQKTVVFKNFTINWTANSHNISNIDKIIYTEYIFINSSGGNGTPYYHSSGDYFQAATNINNTFIITTQNMTNGKVIMTTQYTKTTDAATREIE